jgi:ribose/xylose/arabinose/galactoside ABC-type transport system permease subunit
MTAPHRFRLPLPANERGLILVILAVLAVAALLDSNHTYWNDPWPSAVDIARQTALLGIFSLGAAVVIVSGGIDLSVGSMIAFAGTTCASMMVLLAPGEMREALPVGSGVISAAILGTVAVGFLVGSLHAWLISVVGLPPFVATLATLVGLRSLGRALTEAVTAAKFGGRSTQIQIYDEAFRYLATSVWIPVLVFVLLSLVVSFLLRRTVLGRHIYALGGNEAAARLSGIRTDQVRWVAYSIGALASAIAGVLYIAEQSVAEPQTLGRAYELNAIAAAVVGGCSLKGGVGSVAGTVLGALFLRVVIDGIAKVIKTGADVYEGLVVGLVVVTAVAFSQFRRARAGGRELFAGALGSVTLLALALVTGLLASLMAAPTAGYFAAPAVLALLVAVKLIESRQRKRQRAAAGEVER